MGFSVNVFKKLHTNFRPHIHLQYKDQSQRKALSILKAFTEHVTGCSYYISLSKNLRFAISEVASPHDYIHIKKAHHLMLNFTIVFTAAVN